MNRRGFLGALVYGVFLFVASRLPRNNYGAVFYVKYVDPHGSGMDYHGHLGSYVYNGKRCCESCQVLFAAFKPGGDVDDGPAFYAPTELTPINPAAERILAEIEAGMSEDARRWCNRPRDGEQHST